MNLIHLETLFKQKVHILVMDLLSPYVVIKYQSGSWKNNIIFSLFKA